MSSIQSFWLSLDSGLQTTLIGVAALLLGVCISEFFQWRRFKRQLKRDQLNADMEFAATWKAVLIELWHALERMKYTTEKLLPEPPQAAIPYYTINIVEGLHLSYSVKSGDTEVSQKVYGLYNEVLHFKTKLDDLVALVFEPTAGMPSEPPAAKRFLGLRQALLFLGRSRHWKMVDDYEFCRFQYTSFWKGKKLDQSFDLQLPAVSTISEDEWRNEAGQRLTSS